MPRPFRFSASLGGLPTSEVVGAARRAEELGYSSVTMPDHLTDQPAPLIGLTAAAVATTTLRVLPLVLANDFRHPLVLAKELASLDVLSGGRLEVGIGAGWMLTDYKQAGIPYDRAGTRIGRLAESVEILTALLGGQTISTAGRFYSVTGALSAPLPGQQPRIPLMLAGGKEKMLTLAGAKADIVGINPGLTAGVIDERAGRDCTPTKTDRKLDWIRDGAGARFDRLEIQTRIHLAKITEDRAAVTARVAPRFGFSADDAHDSPHVLLGTVDECIDDIRRWRDRWGISYVSINGEVMEDFAPVVDALTGS